MMAGGCHELILDMPLRHLPGPALQQLTIQPSSIVPPLHFHSGVNTGCGMTVYDVV